MALLAEAKRKVKYGIDPRNTNWSNDDSKFGQKLMEKMGWEKGKGLGASESGMTEHIKASYKSDTRGLGCTPKDADAWIAHQDDFNDLLKALNTEHNTGEEKPEVSTPKKHTDGQKRYYGRFARGRVATLRSTEDLDCIFGKRKANSAPETPASQSADTSDDESRTESRHGLTTVTSSSSVQEYFAQKMAQLKARRAREESCSKEQTGQDEGRDSASAVNDRVPPVFGAVGFSYGDEGESRDDTTEDSRFSENRRVSFNLGGSPSDAEDGEGRAEVSEKKKKKKSKLKDGDSAIFGAVGFSYDGDGNSSNGGNEVRDSEEPSNVTAPEKKKKSKKSRSKDKNVDESSDIQEVSRKCEKRKKNNKAAGEDSDASNVEKSQLEETVDDEEVLETKKKKKRKQLQEEKEEVETEVTEKAVKKKKSKQGNSSDDENTSVATDVVSDDVKSKKKKKSKKRDVEASEENEILESEVAVVEKVKKKSKKKKNEGVEVMDEKAAETNRKYEGKDENESVGDDSKKSRDKKRQKKSSKSTAVEEEEVADSESNASKKKSKSKKGVSSPQEQIVESETQAKGSDDVKTSEKPKKRVKFSLPDEEMSTQENSFSEEPIDSGKKKKGKSKKRKLEVESDDVEELQPSTQTKKVKSSEDEVNIEEVKDDSVSNVASDSNNNVGESGNVSVSKAKAGKSKTKKKQAKKKKDKKKKNQEGGIGEVFKGSNLSSIKGYAVGV